MLEEKKQGIWSSDSFVKKRRIKRGGKKVRENNRIFL
jgi:hypothetical protein